MRLRSALRTIYCGVWMNIAKQQKQIGLETCFNCNTWKYTLSQCLSVSYCPWLLWALVCQGVWPRIQMSDLVHWETLTWLPRRRQSSVFCIFGGHPPSFHHHGLFVVVFLFARVCLRSLFAFVFDCAQVWLWRIGVNLIVASVSLSIASVRYSMSFVSLSSFSGHVEPQPSQSFSTWWRSWSSRWLSSWNKATSLPFIMSFTVIIVESKQHIAESKDEKSENTKWVRVVICQVNDSLVTSVNQSNFLTINVCSFR